MRAIAAVTIPVLASLALVGCAVSATSSPSPSPQLIDELPDGVTVDVYQTRTDPGERKLELAVANASDTAITITGAVFDSTRFAEPVAWTPFGEGTRIPAGFTIDLPVVLAAPVCDDGEAVHIVRIEFVTSEGIPGAASIPAIDRHGILPTMNDTECLAAAAGDVTGLEIVDLEAPPTEGDAIAHVIVRSTPQGDGGEVELTTLHSTVLLKLVDDRGARVDELPADVLIRGTDEPSRVAIPIAPVRCDPHAVAEDKRGTFFDLDIAVTRKDGTTRTGRITLASPDHVRAAIYAYFAESCGLPH